MGGSRGSVLAALAAAAALCLVGAQPAAMAAGSNPSVAAGHAVASAGRAVPGERLWLKRFNDPGNGDDVAHAVVVSPNGSTVFVTGSSTGPSSIDYFTVAYDASTGARLWAKRYNGPGDDVDFANALGVSPNGSTVFVTGGSPGSTTNYDYATVAYAASTGTQRWVKRYNGPGNDNDEAGALGLSPDGSTVFVTGSSAGSGTDHDYATVAYRTSTGTQRWVKRYNGPGNGFDVAHAVGTSPDGSTVFVTGSSDESKAISDYATVAYTASTGTKLWVRRYDGPENDVDSASALATTPDGSTLFVTGWSYGSTDSDYATLAYDASTGTKLWVRRYNGPGDFFDFVRAIRVSPDGSTVFVTGWSYTSQTNSDYATLAYDASTGTRLWLKRYNAPGGAEDSPNALGVSPDGSTVFVTGSSWGGSNYDFATVAMSASTGTSLWVKRYNGPGDGFDSSEDLGVAPDGSAVYVTGESYGSSSYDYATAAYDVT
jgi:sugar lactone lactonase YvrE